MTGIDAEHGRVLARRPLGEQLEFGYDYLILAAGVRQSYFGHDEYAAFAPGMKTLEDALKIRRRIYGAFEMAESADDPAERQRWLTFALVGAGPTGVELAGQVREVATKTLRKEYRHIKPEDARVLLFDGGKTPLAMFGPKLSAPAAPSSPPKGCTSADSRLGCLAVHPHRLPHRLAQPRRAAVRLVVRLRPRHTPRTRLHHRRPADPRLQRTSRCRGQRPACHPAG